MMNQLLMSILAQRKSVPVPQGETWVINESINLQEISFNISFVSNGEHFNDFSMPFMEGEGLGLSYRTTANTFIYAYQYMGAWYEWTNQAYRTITFETAPTGNLLTWLQANAVKQ